jgi:hypothetical protein
MRKSRFKYIERVCRIIKLTEATRQLQMSQKQPLSRSWEADALAAREARLVACFIAFNQWGDLATRARPHTPRRPEASISRYRTLAPDQRDTLKGITGASQHSDLAVGGRARECGVDESPPPSDLSREFSG